MNTPADARQAWVAALRREVARLEEARPPEDDQTVSTGAVALDRLLPAGGLRRGTLVEYLASAAGSGAGTLALAAAREACREGRALIVLDRLGSPRLRRGGSATEWRATPQFYPPAAAAWGIDLSQLLVLQPASEADALWALDQALRCPGVGAVWAAWDRLDVRDFRRLQLAAECGRTLGLLLRPAYFCGQPTWADVQWLVEPRCNRRVGQRRAASADPRGIAAESRQPLFVGSTRLPRGSALRWTHPTWQLQIELVRCRGAAGGRIVHLELDETAGIWREVPDHATHPLPLPAQLADPAAARRA